MEKLDAILNRSPYPVALFYDRMLGSQSWESKVNNAFWCFENTMRFLSLALISYHVNEDLPQIRDERLESVLTWGLPRPLTSTWGHIPFLMLKAYRGHRDQFYFKELYDWYWDLTDKERAKETDPFWRLITLRNDWHHRPWPDDETKRERLFTEVMSYLDEVLKRVSFLEHYELVRVSRLRHGLCEVFLYRGAQVTGLIETLQTNETLQAGAFYLRREGQKLLLLHPLLIFWEIAALQESSAASVMDGDAAIYDKLRSKKRPQYVLTKENEIILPALAGEFDRILDVPARRLNDWRQRVPWLSWELLKMIAAETMARRFEYAASKYRVELYLIRESTRQVFMTFLESDKTCFVLTGKSGVGKTSFFLSLVDELWSNGGICVFYYDAAKLMDLEYRRLSEIFGDDLEPYLAPQEGQQQHKRERDFIAEIEQIPDIAGKKVLLILDAINENADPVNLMRRIDRMLVSRDTSWLKVAVSTRPEFWQRLVQTGFDFSRHKYFDSPTSAEEEWYSDVPRPVTLEGYTDEELPYVYEKVRKANQVVTPYERVSSQLRRFLRDPLALKLLMEAFRAKELPTSLATSVVFKEYEGRLREERIFSYQDLKFLKFDFVPLLACEDSYKRTLTADDVVSARTSTGESLYELIHNDSLLSNNKPVNQSFVRLADADILLKKEDSPGEYEVGFRHERFYDYYVGKHIFEINKVDPNRLALIEGLIRETKKYPFLWGSVFTAILAFARQDGLSSLLPLCHSHDQRVSEMMVSVLEELGQESKEEIEGFLEQLMGTETIRKPKLGFLLPFIERRPPAEAQKLAVAAGSRLGLETVLVQGGLAKDGGVRAAAVRGIYHLWRKDKEAGFRLLERFQEQATGGMLPNWQAFESLMNLSLIIFFHLQDRKVELERLRDFWKRILEKVLRIEQKEFRGRRSFRSFLRNSILKTAVQSLFLILETFPRTIRVKVKDLKQFFELGREDKELYRRLVGYIDPVGDYDRQQMEDDLIAAVKLTDRFSAVAIATVLTVHVWFDGKAFLPTLDKYFEAAKSYGQPNPHLVDAPDAMDAVLCREPKNDEFFSRYVTYASECQEYYSKEGNQAAGPPGVAASALYMWPYIFHQSRRSLIVSHDDWLRTRIKKALKRGDTPFFEAMLENELPCVALDMEKPKAALDVLALFLDQLKPPLVEKAQYLLARLRAIYTDEVDDFLDSCKLSDEFRRAVQTCQPKETVGSLVGMKFILTLRNALIEREEMRKWIRGRLADAADAGDATSWTIGLVKSFVNLIYEKDVFGGGGDKQ